MKNTEKRIYNKFKSRRAMGMQHYGNRIFVEEWIEPYYPDGGGKWVAIERSITFIPCLSISEPTKLNRMGSRGGMVLVKDIPNQTQVDKAIKFLEKQYKIVE